MKKNKNSSKPGGDHMPAEYIDLWDKIHMIYTQANMIPTIQVPALELLILLDFDPKEPANMPESVGAMLIEEARSSLLEAAQLGLYDLAQTADLAMQLVANIKANGEKAVATR